VIRESELILVPEKGSEFIYTIWTDVVANRVHVLFVRLQPPSSNLLTKEMATIFIQGIDMGAEYTMAKTAKPLRRCSLNGKDWHRSQRREMPRAVNSGREHEAL
jgi:hypothetical protein